MDAKHVLYHLLDIVDFLSKFNIKDKGLKVLKFNENFNFLVDITKKVRLITVFDNLILCLLWFRSSSPGRLCLVAL